ncbi:hypothetical protein LLG46_03335 [bacterium]|nr:hypothetical protein [bacterium]
MPGAVVCGSDIFYAATLEKNENAFAITPIIITNEILGLISKSSRFAQLLDYPEHRWVLGNPKVDNLASFVVHGNEDVKESERECRDHEEVGGAGCVHMVLDERLPSLCGRAHVSCRFGQILPNCVR